MADIQWLFIRQNSSHIRDDRVPDAVKALCGRKFGADTTQTTELGERKSCESCLRINAKRS